MPLAHSRRFPARRTQTYELTTFAPNSSSTSIQSNPFSDSHAYHQMDHQQPAKRPSWPDEGCDPRMWYIAWGITIVVDLILLGLIIWGLMKYGLGGVPRQSGGM
ncbi:hypothetical protein K440DRAFT_641443 [Wilcoxina mikolae CBS 423.85]|nr:hypothetical protein K440DRAFT_641443 [Wilcoxina mikolae CBS 423.85]